MPKEPNVKRVLVIGRDPIVIGQGGRNLIMRGRRLPFSERGGHGKSSW